MTNMWQKEVICKMLISKVGIEKKKTPALCGSLKVKYDDLGKMSGIL